MNIESILSGALSGGIITFIWNLYNRRNEYNFEHKKYILKKRQVAYEQIEKLLIRFQVRNIDASDKQQFHNIFFDSRTPDLNLLTEFNADVNDILGNSLWLSDKLLNHITTVNAIINSALLMLPQEYDLQQNVVAGKNLFLKIEKVRIELFHQYLTDMKNLKNTNQFLRKKRFL